jgi:hypothetical protein
MQIDADAVCLVRAQFFNKLSRLLSVLPGSIADQKLMFN